MPQASRTSTIKVPAGSTARSSSSSPLPALPRFGFNIVDVRDIARLHARAMTTPEAAGQRFIGSGDFYWMSDVAKMLKQGLGDKAKKVPRSPCQTSWRGLWRCSIRLSGDGYSSWGSGDRSRRRRLDECWDGRLGR
jgi:nucleoside-diphosphate-sugar epimerase